MSKFLEILHEALKDHKYGWEKKTFPDEETLRILNFNQEMATKGQAALNKMPPPPRGYYGNDDCSKEWWDKERKIYF